jgi:glycerol-3-phosphate acyltransferase PlsY
MLDLMVKVLLAYMLGSISGSMVMGALRHVDIRSSGSGNAGGTNAFRTQGFRFALGVVIIDIGKGALAAGLLPSIELAALGQPLAFEYGLLACGFAAVVGHCYPLWYGFRGGKGAATAVGALAVIQPWALIPMFITWVLVLVLTGWVGLATMLSALSLIPAFLVLDETGPRMIFAIILALFVVFTHRSNIRKMLNGSENRFERIRIVNWFGHD